MQTVYLSANAVLRNKFPLRRVTFHENRLLAEIFGSSSPSILNLTRPSQRRIENQLRTSRGRCPPLRTKRSQKEILDTNGSSSYGSERSKSRNIPPIILNVCKVLNMITLTLLTVFIHVPAHAARTVEPHNRVRPNSPYNSCIPV